MAQATELTPVMSEDEALGWTLKRAKRGPLQISDREAARSWGWPDTDKDRMKVRRLLARWEAQGLITRDTQPGRRQTIAIGTLNIQVNNSPVQPAETVVAAAAPGFTPPVHQARIGVHHVGAVLMGGLALTGFGIALLINVNFGHSLGRTPEAALLFSGLAAVADAAGFLLPATARALWQGGNRSTALSAWGLLLLVILPMAWLAAIGFAAVNISDTSAGRAKIANAQAALTAQVERLAKEREAITETRAVAALEAEIQATQSQAPVAAVWSRTGGCKDVTQPKSGEACAPLLRLRQALGEASRRDAIDADVHDKQAQLAALPAVSSADPQAEEAAQVVTWISRGVAAPAPSDFAMLRLTLLAALQVLVPGLLLMLAGGLWTLETREANP